MAKASSPPDLAMSGLVERTLRRDRTLLAGAMGLLFLLACFYTVFGVGMNMTALDMTRMAGMRDMPSPRFPGDWSVGYAVLVFLMWWVMMVAMMLPSVAPTVLLYATLLRRTSAVVQAPATAGAFERLPVGLGRVQPSCQRAAMGT